MSSVLQLGSHRACAVVLFLHILPFYTSNWEEYCTGVMRFGMIGITEGQLLICFLLALTGYVGSDYWNTRLPLPDWLAEYAPSVLAPSFREPMEAKFVLVAVGALGVGYQLVSSCLSVWEHQRAHAQRCASARIYNKAKRMFAHYLAFCAAGVCWVAAPGSFYAQHPRIVLLTVGMLFGYQVVRKLCETASPANIDAASLTCSFILFFSAFSSLVPSSVSSDHQPRDEGSLSLLLPQHSLRALPHAHHQLLDRV